ncbi:hypothetical protein CEUSTIGMA_g8286.t1 [Chlamydomonas eustigma]|uniref:Uncharacterized protein n=1 Tax=Chlamydomonas eustigma TaxID=1157962 RepID=A0A250XCP7_9CHLO|nr:hypothetical protein CEUSTIGMA_g8286.t1 [Chlamydomonas eustigma]|eukprot:GAX80851.1 hypothetical protein CEUSTIGMA_g8286.t1 [Chlamydomonas eustigma]
MNSDVEQAASENFFLVKTICEAADAWALDRLGHNYVRINNKTIEIRSLWSRWSTSNRSRAAVASEAQSRGAVLAAIKHSNIKMKRCQERLDRYIRRGLFLRTAYQAAQKVLKVLSDVDCVLSVTLIEGESPRSPAVGPKIQTQKASTNSAQKAYVISQQTASKAAETKYLEDLSPAAPSVLLRTSQREQEKSLSLTPLKTSKDSTTHAAASLTRNVDPSSPVTLPSPRDTNPLAKPGFVVHIPGAEKAVQEQALAPSSSRPITQSQNQHLHTTSLEPQKSLNPTINDQRSDVRFGSVIPQIHSALSLEADGTVMLGGQRYMVVMAQNVGSTASILPGSANAYLVSVPQQQQQKWQQNITSEAQNAADQHLFTLPRMPVIDDAIAIPARAAPRIPMNAQQGKVDVAARDTPSKDQVQTLKRGRPNMSITYPLSTLRALAAAGLKAEDARQLLAQFGPGSATAALQASGHVPQSTVLTTSSPGKTPASSHVAIPHTTMKSSMGAISDGSSRDDLNLPQDEKTSALSQVPMLATTHVDAAVSAAMNQDEAVAEAVAASRVVMPHLDMQQESRRSLWARLPAPGQGSTLWGRNRLRPAVYDTPSRSRGAASSARVYHVSKQEHSTSSPLQLHGISPLIKSQWQHRPTLLQYSLPGCTSGRVETMDSKVLQVLDTYVAPTASLVYQGLMASRVARGVAPAAVGDMSPQTIYARDGGSMRGDVSTNDDWVREGEGMSVPSRAGRLMVTSPPSLQHREHSQYSPPGAAVGQTVQQTGRAGEEEPAAYYEDTSLITLEGRRNDMSAESQVPSSVEGKEEESSILAVRLYAAELSKRTQGGDLEAMEELGGMVRVGMPGLPAQPEVARGLLLIAAEAGSASACISVGEMYEGGEGGSSDPDQALKWYQQGQRILQDGAEGNA